MEINDLTVRRIYAAIGKDATRDLLDYIDSKAAGGSEVFDSPILTGLVQVGQSPDQVGFFGTTPIPRPAGADEAPVGALTAGMLTYVGTPDNALGDSGNLDDNNRLASLANQINNIVTDLAALQTLLNRLRSDLLALGLIKGDQ